MNNNFLYKNEKGPLFASIDVTTACNFHCLHCYNNSGKKLNNEMSDTEIIKVASDLAKLKPASVCLCGGEPLLRNNVIEIIETLSTANGSVNIVSNGSLLTDEKANALKRAGLHTLQISLDGINSSQHDTFRGFSGAFDLAVKAIRTGVKENISVVTSFVPNKLNINCVEEYLELCLDLGVSSARFMPLIPMGRGSNINSLLLNSDEYYKLQITLEKAKCDYSNTPMTIEWGDPIEHYSRMVTNAMNNIKTVSLEVKANGNLTISTYIPIVVGNIRDHSLLDYWDGGYKDIWANKDIIKYVSNIQNIYDIGNLKPEPYSGEYLYYNIL